MVILATLATVGSTSPYVGLFGTVWGIMSAFTSLGSVQQATLAAVAPGIAEALVATAIGLFAAIPAVIAYNVAQKRINDLEADAQSLGRLGIRVDVRLIDDVQYWRRLSAFDFDMIQWTWPVSASPGNEQIGRWRQQAAEVRDREMELLARNEELLALDAADLDAPEQRRAIREQAASAIDLIVHISRLRDGSRRVTQVVEVAGMEGDTITLTDLFTFDYSAGIDEEGRFLGVPVPTGLRPKFVQRLADQGIHVPDSVFISAGSRDL